MMSLSRSFFVVLTFLLFISPLFAIQAAQESTKDASAVKNTAESSAETEPSVQVTDLLERLAINQGKGQFVQQKHFSFMSVPITSTGYFIVKEQSALWQTEQPVFSALLLKPNAIYRRLSLDENYQLLTDSAEFSGVLATIFTGKVNGDDWQLNSSVDNVCLELTPKSGQLKQLFKQVDLCLVEVEQESEALEKNTDKTPQKRQITLTDSKGDKTVIMMTLSNDAFLNEDLDALKLTGKSLGEINAS